MSTQEQTKEILTWILLTNSITVSECEQYPSWSPEYVKHQLTDTVTRLFKYCHRKLEEGYLFDPTQLTLKELQQFGFMVFDESEDPLILIPFYLYRYLNVLFLNWELTDISNKKIKVTNLYTQKESTHYLDNDHRFGALAYGFKRKK